MLPIEVEMLSEKTSETAGETDILVSAEEHAKYGQIPSVSSCLNESQEQSPVGFSEGMSEPCSSENHGAITSQLSKGSKQSVEKALDKMPDKVLREVFRLEANTHKAMMQRVAAGKAKCVKRWRSLRPFLVDILWEIGPRPSATHTLDRKNNAVRRYGPGLCRWALPEVQNNNRSCSVTIKHPVTGKLLSAADVAAWRGIGERHARRLMKTKTADEIFAGESKPNHIIVLKPAPKRGWYDNFGDWHDKDEEEAYWREFHEHFGSPRIPSLKPLPLPEEQLGSRCPDEEWLLIDEVLRHERAERALRRMEEEDLTEAKAALTRVQSGEERWLLIEHVLALHRAGISLPNKDQDWERLVLDNPYRF